ncbi:DUF1295 domain-containing protein [Halorhodospira halophila]|uniref:Uncharacterized protein n=1 Tax=Halorhodospira halophila (strain DSM 244 / SL1) TaxID=349124 RepID=A1WTM8_HALHL|nr:DUF1295 domain-containing protein [Halorhodospira halophila]ABM61040.1 protein of unknown function DUF1295 [Halorhodospira halophila SL1]MBK1730134.1 DUF1295 domain-containing protein [Halorhodospira halophila]
MLVSAIAGLGAVLLLMTAVWAYSLRTGDASLVDRYWGAGFVLLALLYQALAGLPAHGWWIVALVALWGGRLSGYLTWRSWGAGEDARYAALRRAGGPGWARRSLVTVFWLQAVVLWLAAAPVLHAIARGDAQTWTGPVALAAAALFLFGWLYEAVADWQLARFRATARNAGEVCDRGLWRYSRHPNYFGEILVAWGLWGLAAAAGGWWTVFAPLLMTALLLRVSGVPLLEAHLRKHRPGYAAYAAGRNAVIPGPPRPPGKESARD